MARVAEQTRFKVTVPGFKHWEVDKLLILLAGGYGAAAAYQLPTPHCTSSVESALSLTPGYREQTESLIGEKLGFSPRSDQLGLRHVQPHNGDVLASSKMTK